MIMKRQKSFLLAMLLVILSISVSTFAQDFKSQAKGERETGGDNLAIPNCVDQPIQFGQVINGTISATDCVSPGGATIRADEYTFTGTAGQKIVITQNSDEQNNPGTNAVDSFLVLRQITSAPGVTPVTSIVLTFDDDGGTNGSTGIIRNSRIPAVTGFFTLPANATYSIEASTFSGGPTSFGPYTLQLIDGGSSTCGATFINYTVNPQPTAGQLQTTDCVARGQFYTDRYAFDGVAGQSVTIDMATTGGGGSIPLDPYLILSGPGNTSTVLAENNDSGPGTTSARITFTLPATGTYFVDATSNLENQTGNYNVTLTLNLPAGTIPVSVDDVVGSIGGQVIVPIRVGLLPTNTVRSFQFTFNYNPAVLRPVANPMDITDLGISQTGTLSAPLACDTNPNGSLPPVQNPGAIRVGCFAPSATPFINGSGVLINLVFDVIGNGGTKSAVVLTSFMFNEGIPASFVFTSPGCVLVNGYSIRGNTYYYAGTINGGPKPIAAVQVTGVPSPLANDPTVQADTNVRGAYALQGLSATTYNVTPRKNGDLMPVPTMANPMPIPFITSQDAQLTNLHAVGLANLALNARRAADVSGNGQVTSFDASLINQFAVGVTTIVGNRSGQWRFVSPGVQASDPVIPPAQNSPADTALLLNYSGAQNYTAAQILTNPANQNYLGILIGDVTGNFVQPCSPTPAPGTVLCDTTPPPPPTAVPENIIPVDLPEVTSPSNTVIEVPVNVGDITNRGATSFNFTVKFNPNVLRPAPSAVVQSGTLSSSYFLDFNPIVPGELRVGAFGINPMSGAGALVKLRFEVIGAPGSNSELRWEQFFFNEGDPASVRTDGTFLVAGRTPFDFDGDGKSDTNVFRSGNSTWYQLNSQAGFSAVNWGLPTDQLAPADYDGDGRTDVAVVRDNTWYILRSNGGTSQIDFGLAGDLPVAGDWDGDGRADVAVYRAGTNGGQGTFYFRGTNNNPSGAITFVPWGLAGDVPVMGDYDGDGRLDAAVFRPSTGVWYINRSSDNQLRAYSFGLSTDKLVPADYDGDGSTDIGVYRDGVWYVLKSGSGVEIFNFGLAGDTPVPADYDGDGKSDVAVYRGGVWHLLQSSQGYRSLAFGVANDKPIPASFLR